MRSPRNGQVEDGVGPTREVERAARERFVHGHDAHRRSGRCRHGRRARRRCASPRVSATSSTVWCSSISRSPTRRDLDVDEGVVRERRQEVVVEADARGDGGLARSRPGRRSRRCASRAVSRTCSARRGSAHRDLPSDHAPRTSTSRSSCRRSAHREAQMLRQRVARPERARHDAVTEQVLGGVLGGGRGSPIRHSRKFVTLG